MAKVIKCIFLVLVIIYIVPFLVYSLFSIVAGLRPPEGASPLQFLLSVLVSKVGTSFAFVLILYLARQSLVGRWLGYALIWWVMFIIGEVGQAIGPHYTWKEAIAIMASKIKELRERGEA